MCDMTPSCLWHAMIPSYVWHDWLSRTHVCQLYFCVAVLVGGTEVLNAKWWENACTSHAHAQAHKHTHTHIHIHTHTVCVWHAHTHTRTRTRTRTPWNTCVYIFVSRYVCVRVGASVCKRVYARVCACNRLCVCAYESVYVRICVCVCIQLHVSERRWAPLACHSVVLVDGMWWSILGPAERETADLVTHITFVITDHVTLPVLSCYLSKLPRTCRSVWIWFENHLSTITEVRSYYLSSSHRAPECVFSSNGNVHCKLADRMAWGADYIGGPLWKITAGSSTAIHILECLVRLWGWLTILMILHTHTRRLSGRIYVQPRWERDRLPMSWTRRVFRRRILHKDFTM